MSIKSYSSLSAMYTILEHAPVIENGFLVRIPDSFALPIGLQKPFLNILFDCDDNEYYLIQGDSPIITLKTLTTHGCVYRENPTLSLAYYIQHGVSLKTTTTAFLKKYYGQEFAHIKNINTKIPLTKWIEYAESLYSIHCSLDWDLINQSDVPAYSTFIYNLTQIERSGLAVDPELFQEFFEADPIRDNLTYTKYNPYTVTGRPSNAFNNINYAALPKESGARSAFISRFESGKLIEIDFKSYHIHLVANLMGYTFDCDDIHTHFGQFYYNTQKLSQSQYEDSKTRTFKSLYSNDKPDHPFFNRIRALTEVLYQEYQTTGAITSPILRRRIKGITDPSPNKVFNYFVQCYETERNSQVIQEILDTLEGFSSKMVLYTYDSILIDFNMEDGRPLLDSILYIFTKDPYPFSLKVGSDYDNLKAKI